MKTVFMVIIFFLCFLFWQIKRIRLFRRVDSLRKIKAFVMGVGDDIRSLKKNVFDIISTDKTGFGFFRDISLNGELLYTYYLRAKDKNGESLCLKREDEEVFDRFFRELGQGDSESQLQLCNEIVTDINKCLEDAEDKNMRYGKLYTVTGLSMGAFAVIILL